MEILLFKAMPLLLVSGLSGGDIMVDAVVVGVSVETGSEGQTCFGTTV